MKVDKNLNMVEMMDLYEETFGDIYPLYQAPKDPEIAIPLMKKAIESGKPIEIEDDGDVLY